MANYKIFNETYNEAFQFTSVYNTNNKECLTIPPRSFVGGMNDVLGYYYTSDPAARESMIRDIFALAAKHPEKISITKDGVAVNYDTYRQDFA